MTCFAWLSLLCAALPTLLFLRNLRAFHLTSGDDATPVSILIPARDEEKNIALAVAAALDNRHAEVLVLDDGSTDRTAVIVRELSEGEPRVRLLTGDPLPAGWCGKNFACAQLAAAAAHPLLLFVDADVQVSSDAASRLAHALRIAKADLISGIPREEVRTFSEILLVPLIHFVLLGFLPLERMRRSNHEAYATGCGQLIMTDAHAYLTSGGHAAICDQIHDGLALPKLFRRRGHRTDLIDATDLATCRMYQRNADVWRGLLKNTHEGMGAPARIVPFTLFLLAGQVLPFVLLFCTSSSAGVSLILVTLAALLALLPRIISIRRFHQPLLSAFLHPIGVTCLLAIQWVGLCRFLLRRPATWRGRKYTAVGL